MHSTRAAEGGRLLNRGSVHGFGPSCHSDFWPIRCYPAGSESLDKPLYRVAVRCIRPEYAGCVRDHDPLAYLDPAQPVVGWGRIYWSPPDGTSVLHRVLRVCGTLRGDATRGVGKWRPGGSFGGHGSFRQWAIPPVLP